MNTTEKLSRRNVLFGLAAAGAGLAVAGTAKANFQAPPDILEAQRAQLQNVLEHVEIADAKITRVASGWVAPPDIRPELNAMLTDINTECQNVMNIATELLQRTTPS